MNDPLTHASHYLQAHSQAIHYLLPLGLVCCALAAWAILKALSESIAFIERKRSKTTKELFKVKQVILANQAITEFYAPAKNYTQELLEGDEKRPQKKAWLSPYPRAVKASFKRNKGSKRTVLDARRQVKDAAQHVHVEHLPNAASYGDPTEHFLVRLDLNGNDADKVKGLAGPLRAQLGLNDLAPTVSTDTYSVAFRCHKTPPRDRLAESKIGSEFFDAHPARSVNSLPLALTEEGTPWALPTHHTLIYGTTGSGKGSPVNGIIRQLAPHVDAGIVQLYGIDPKRTELLPYGETPLFKKVVYTTLDAQALIWEVYELMEARAQSKTIDFEGRDLGRDLPATKKNPMILLIIDELLSLLNSLKSEGAAGRATHGLLVEILAKGRSLGVYVIAATQSVDTELLGRMRINFANAIILRQESDHFNGLFLGDTAKANGFDSTAIGASNKANGYKYSGIGYVKEESGAPVKVRFAYSSDDAISDLCLRHARAKKPTPTLSLDKKKDEPDFDSYDELPDLFS